CKRFQTLPGGGCAIPRLQKLTNRMLGYANPPPHKKKANKNACQFKLVAVVYLITAAKTTTAGL
ncbi:hypothetical protein ACVGW7_00495, partial [Enterobacter intestinihominis]